MTANRSRLEYALAQAYGVIVGRRGVPILLVVATALLSALALAIWMLGARAAALSMRIPQAPAMPTGIPVTPVAHNEGALIAGAGVPSSDRGTWPQFRGIDRSNTVSDVPLLARTWSSSGLRVLWKLTVGEGHAGAAIRNGCVYLIDYDREKQEDVIRCLSLDDGRDIWRYSYYVEVKRNHGMSRTVPAVTDKYVVTLGPKCHVHCLDAATGRLIWKKDLVAECGTVAPPWYAGQCPLIEGDRVILAPGGNPLMMSVELSSGKVVWETPNPGKWLMTHSSIAAMDYDGKRQYIYCTTQGVVGVSATDGKLLWTKPDWKIALATVPSPLPVGDNRIFLSGGYESGCVMIQLEGDEDHITTREIFRLPHTVFGAPQHTPILYSERIYGVTMTGELACLDLDGKRLWSSGMSHRFGLGPFIIAGGLILALNDQEGTLHMAEASPRAYNELAESKVLDGHDAWAPIAMAGNKLILRDLTTIVCLELPLAQLGAK